ncbi:hypothetical protein [Sphingobium aquiterrae]|uniref:hypothetical protein n=1 Tax=Sphingobium aquiterrae TaxID=2038656 RepID=UPI003016871F
MIPIQIYRFLGRGKIVAKILALCLLALPKIAEASEAQLGYVRVISAGPNGIVFFTTDGPRTARPTCATLQRWVIDVSSPGGQALMSQLLTAYTSQIKIRIDGKGVCDVWADTESIKWLTMEQ